MFGMSGISIERIHIIERRNQSKVEGSLRSDYVAPHFITPDFWDCGRECGQTRLKLGYVNVIRIWFEFEKYYMLYHALSGKKVCLKSLKRK